MFFKSDIKSFSKKLESFSERIVGDNMTKDVMTISPEDSLINAANIMIGHHISCLVVKDKDSEKPLGIITENDFLTKSPTDWKKLKSMKVKNIMTKNAVAVRPSLSLMAASEILDAHYFRKLLVTKDENLVGIITQTDLVKSLNEFYQKNKFKSSDSLTVSEVNEEAVKVKITEKISKVRDKMAKKKTGTSFVFNKYQLAGIFTEYDFLSELALHPEDLNKVKVGDVMSFPVVGVKIDVDIFDAARLTLDKGFRRMPVLKTGQFKGKVSQRILRKRCFQILKKTLERAEEKQLDKINFELIKQKELVREIFHKVQEFKYPPVT